MGLIKDLFTNNDLMKIWKPIDIHNSDFTIFTIKTKNLKSKTII